MASSEAVEVFSSLEGRIPVTDHGKVEGFGEKHRRYNDAVDRIVDTYLKDNPNVQPNKMTTDQARDVLQRVKISQDPAIREFNRQIFNRFLHQTVRGRPRDE